MKVVSMELIYNAKNIIDDGNKLVHEFSASNPHVMRAIKAAASATISITICILLNLDEALFAGITAMIMLQPNVGATITKGLFRSIGTLCGAAIATFIFLYVFQTPFFFTAATFIFMGVIFYKKATSEYSYAWYVAGITFVLIASAGIIEPTTINVIDTAYFRGVNVLIGIAVSLLISRYVFPEYAKKEHQVKLANYKKAFYSFLSEFVDFYISGKYTTGFISQRYEKLLTAINSIQSIMDNAAKEDKNISKYIPVLNNMQQTLTELYDFGSNLEKIKSASIQKKYVSAIKKIVSDMGKMETNIDSKSNLNYRITCSEIENTFKLIENKTDKFVEKGINKTYSISESLLFYEFIMILKNVYFMYKSYSDLATGITILRKAHLNKDKVKDANYLTINFLFKELRLHIPSLKFAIKGALSIIIVIWGWKLLGNPSSNNGEIEISISVLTIIQPDFLASNLRALQRISGCLIGMALGILLLAVGIEFFYGMMIAYFIVMFISGYIITGGTNISYVGLQIAIAYMVATLATNTPQFNIEPVLFRFLGIFFAIITVWIINSLFWNDSLPTTLKKNMSNIWNKLFPARNDEKIILNAPAISDINSVRTTLKTMSNLNLIPQADLILLKQWINVIERLSISIELFNSLSSEEIEFINKLDPEILINTAHAIRNSADSYFKGELDLIVDELTELSSEVERIKYAIRFGAMKDEKMEEKEYHAHTIMLLRRMASRLQEAVISQININKQLSH